MREPQYVDLDVAPIFNQVPVSQYGVAIASTIENKTWYAYEDSRIDPSKMNRFLKKLKSSNRRSFPKVWDEFKNYADDHFIWVNEISD